VLPTGAHLATGDPVVVAEALTKRYGDTLALDGLDLAIREGEVYGFLGPNGAGKTTTIRLLLGLHRPTSGRAALFGIDAWRDPVQAHARTAYVAGEPTLWPSLTGEECLAFLARLHGSLDRELQAVLIDRFEFDPGKRVRDYSKGNRQKIQLIAAFAGRPDLLVLDEPTSGLDPLMEAAFRDTVAEAKASGQTVFLSSHILSEVEALCDRVGILRAGRLVEEGTLAELRHLSALTVDVTFANGVPPLAPLPGVEVTSAGESTLRFQVHGPIGPLLDALAGTSPVSLRSREPTLEELFLAHYAEEA
jgi:ABC-2 type transport system ATP-binding protein